MPEWQYILDRGEFAVLERFIMYHHPDCPIWYKRTMPQLITLPCNCGYDAAIKLLSKIRAVVNL